MKWSFRESCMLEYILFRKHCWSLADIIQELWTAVIAAQVKCFFIYWNTCKQKKFFFFLHESTFLQTVMPFITSFGWSLKQSTGYQVRVTGYFLPPFVTVLVQMSSMYHPLVICAPKIPLHFHLFRINSFAAFPIWITLNLFPVQISKS